MIDDLAAVCGYLPLALRIAVAHLVDRPYRTIAQHVRELRQGNRLGGLTVEGDDAAAVGSTFALSYDAVPVEAQLLFRRLGLVACPDFNSESSAALAGLPQAQTAELLERLVDAHLVNPLPNGRYGIHDLLHEYARETCVAVDSAAERDKAVARLLTMYLTKVQAAGDVLYPATIRLPSLGSTKDAFPNAKTALAWLDAEHANIVAAIRPTPSADCRPLIWLLAHQLRGYFDLRRHKALWFTSARAGLIAARKAEDQQAQAAMFQMLGHAYAVVGRFDTATTNLERAIQLSERCEWDEGLALALGSLGVAKGLQGSTDADVPLLRSLQLFRVLGNVPAEVKALNNLANCRRQQGDLLAAIDLCQEATSKSQGDREPYCVALSSLGAVRHLLGLHEFALQSFNSALTGVRKLGSKPIEAFVLAYMSGVYADLGRWSEARESATAAVNIARTISHPPALVCGLTQLGRCLLFTHNEAEAYENLQEAVETASKTGTRFELVGALIALSQAEAASDGHRALRTAHRALDLSVTGRFRVHQGQALVALGDVHMSQCEHSKAMALAAEALQIQRATGHRLGEADALRVLSLADADPSAAAKHAAAAKAIYWEVGAVSLLDLPIS